MLSELLDYGKFNPFGMIIGRSRQLAWPVNVYRVTLPQCQQRSAVNAFERVILKIMRAVPRISEERLVFETCLPQALVHGILQRLQDRGFVDEHLKIVEGEITHWESSTDQLQQYETALFFQELGTGKFLPYLQFLANHPLKKNNREEELSFLKKMPLVKDETFPTPKPRDIILALKEMQKLCKFRAVTSRIPDVQQIVINPRPEPYWLPAPIAIQASDGDFRIGDPFGNGCSSLLENLFQRFLREDEKVREWYEKWKVSLEDQNGATVRQRRFPFDTPELRNRYPRLINCLVPKGERQFRSISDIYAALEWTLFYFCRQISTQKAIEILKMTPDLSAKLESIVASLGFTQNTWKFLPVLPGKITDFQEQKAEMPTLIAILLLLGNSNFEVEKVLHMVAVKHPDFFTRLNNVRNLRNRDAHGERQSAGDVEQTDDAFMRDVIPLFLPEVHFLDSEKTEPNLFSDYRFMARNHIQSFFGYGMDPNLEDRLIAAEAFWQTTSGMAVVEDVLPFVSHLYAVCQILLRTCIDRYLRPHLEDSNLLSYARQKATNAGFDEIPGHIQGTRLERVRETLQTLDKTLGASILAYLIVANDDDLRIIASRQPDFLKNLDDLIVHRGHGNQIVSMKKSDFDHFRKITYQTVKTLMEIEPWESLE